MSSPVSGKGRGRAWYAQFLPWCSDSNSELGWGREMWTQGASNLRTSWCKERTLSSLECECSWSLPSSRLQGVDVFLPKPESGLIILDHWAGELSWNNVALLCSSLQLQTVDVTAQRCGSGYPTISRVTDSPVCFFYPWMS